MAYNKNELIHKIQALPELSNEEKSALLELLRTHKKYGLVWEDKPENVEDRLRNELPVLKEVKERAIISSEPDAPNHILIEGDNLEALVALTYTHSGKIDVIYIDPPYNTGNKDFIYNDSYVDVEDSFRHSKWISFINRRLKIAKSLLSMRGVIFISIDDNEQAQLKMICDEVFGSQNFISTFVWSAGRKNDSKYVSVSHEYILCYVNNIDYLKQNQIVWRERKQGIDDIYATVQSLKRQFGSDYQRISLELKNWYRSLPDNHPAKNHKHYNCVDERGVYFPSDISWPGGGGPKYEVLHPVTGKPVRIPNRGWVYPSAERMQEVITQGLVHFGPDESSVPCKKTYLSDNESAAPYSVFYKDGRAATKRLRSILGEDMFQNPKDDEIIQKLLDFSSLKDSTVLDFFAGSGTTLQSTMQLNSSDGGHRTCILVTNNENGICENVTYERNRRIIEGYTSLNGTEITGLKGNNLRYFKTAFVGRERTAKNMRELMCASTELLCVKNDLYEEVQQLSGKTLNPKVARFFSDGKKRMLVIYQEEAIPTIAELMASMDCSGKILVYVFSPGNYPYEDEFVDVLDKVELCALPAAIYNAYMKVLPKKKVIKLPEADELDY